MKKFIIGLCAIGFVLSSCGGKKVSFSYTPTILCTPTVVDIENKFSEQLFDQIGLDTNYVEIKSGAGLIEALEKDEVQILSLVTLSPVISMASKGGDIVILEVNSRSPKAYTIYSKDNSITLPSDLVGKTIAGPKDGLLQYLLIAYLATEGYTLDDVNFVNMSIADACSQLDAGSVDCALLNGSEAYFAKSNGFNLITDGEGFFKAISVVATKRDYYENNREIVETFLEAKRMSYEFMKEHPKETITELSKKFNLPEEVIVDSLSQYDYSPTITENDIIAMIHMKDFMLSQGLIQNDVDIRSLIVN